MLRLRETTINDQEKWKQTHYPFKEFVMPNYQDLYSVKDTCKRLGGISRATYYRLVNSGDLQKVSIGSRAFTPAGSLDAYLKKIGA